MAERKKPEIEFVSEIPPKGEASSWVVRLRPLVENPGRPAMIKKCRSARQAGQTVDNLSRRLVAIPRPDHDWVFTARENLVFAIYKGEGLKRGSVRRAK